MNDGEGSARTQRAQKQVHGTAKRAHIYSGFLLWDFFYQARKKEHGSLLTDPLEQISPYLEPIINIEFLWYRLYKNEQFLRQKYLVEGLSTREIAQGTFSVRSTVVRSLKEFNIPLRPMDIAHRMNKGQLGYGERLVERRESGHRKELQNIVKMTELRSRGFSYHKIAAILNSMGIPTKNRKQWHATTVMNILSKSSPMKVSAPML